MSATPEITCPPGHRMVKLRKCCRCRTVYPEDEAVKKPHKKFSGATSDVCPKCGAETYYLHHAGEKKAPRSEVYRASPWPIQQATPLREAIASIRGKEGLIPEAARLLDMAQQSAAGVPLAELLPQLEAVESELSKFITFMRLCFDHRELKAQFDRLRGTNVSRRGSPMDLMIDTATGKLEDAARAFFGFCLDLYHRLPKA